MPSEPLRILHLEDDEADAYLIRRAIQSKLRAVIEVVDSREAFLTALERSPWDVVISDNALPAFSSRHALAAVRERGLAMPFIVLSGAAKEAQIADTKAAGATDFISKHQLPELIAVLQSLADDRSVK